MAWPYMLIGDIVTSEKISNVQARPWLIGIILITPYLLTLSIWIQITIHPLSTDGAFVI